MHCSDNAKFNENTMINSTINPLTVGIRQPQNDRAHEKSVARSYGDKHQVEIWVTENGQNGLNGCSKRTDDLSDFRLDWTLHQRPDGTPLITLQDAGTTGFTGRTYGSEDDLYNLTNVDSVSSDDKLLRMNSMYQSGNNAGGGTEGQGGKVFNLRATEDSHVFYDTLRADDNQYLAFSHFYSGSQRRSSLLSYSIEDVRNLINFEGLPDIKAYGARVILAKPVPEIVEAMQDSFEPDNSIHQSESVAYFFKRNFLVAMEAGAEMYLHWGKKTKQVVLDEFDKFVLHHTKDGSSQHRVVLETADGKHQAILRVACLPEKLQTKYKGRRKGVRCYRAMQDVGEFGLMTRWNEIAAKGVVGVITFDHALEKLLAHFENSTHTNVNFRPSPKTKSLSKEETNYVIEIGRLIEEELESWQKQFVDESTSEKDRDAAEFTSQWNSILRQLNIGQSHGNRAKTPAMFSVNVDKPGMLYMDGQTLPSLPVLITNKSGKVANGVITMSLIQGDKEIAKWQKEKKLAVDSSAHTVMPKEGFVLSSDEFSPGEFRVKVTVRVDQKTYSPMYSILYFEQSPNNVSTVTPVTLLCPELAIVKEKGSMYEGDSIPSHTTTLFSNHTADLDLIIRSSLIREGTRSGVPRSVIAVQSHNLILRAGETMSEMFLATELTESLMADVLMSESLPEERKCVMKIDVALRNYDAKLNLGREDVLVSRSFMFYFGVEPPGDGAFVTRRLVNTDAVDQSHRNDVFWSEYSKDDNGRVLCVNMALMLPRLLEQKHGEKSLEFNLYCSQGLVREALMLDWRAGRFSDYAEHLGRIVHDGDVDPLEYLSVASQTVDTIYTQGEVMYKKLFARAQAKPVRRD